MFKYVNDVSNIAHNIIKNTISRNTALDATLGNGFDTDFLSALFKRVYSFDIQKHCIENYKQKHIDNVTLINDSHANMDIYIKEPIDFAMFNLGFLPGGDKSITTNYESTVKALESTLKLLTCNGIVTIALYPGHEAGKIERDRLLRYAAFLPKQVYGVLHHSFINRENNPPELRVIEKK
ncbi:MAG: class I SAM-dependent methyltransferase [Bacillota bacterium]|nr:class I SAM-dependent methyltransferase [Bacillota bacterium]